MQSVPLLFSAAKRLEGKVALITGAASGIGEATAKLFARHGARIVIADVQDDKGHALCSALGPSVASYVHCDVTNESDVQQAVDATVSHHGKLDVMFNNAGIIGEPCLRLLESEKSDFEHVVATNLVGSYLGTKHAARAMLPARRGSIVITASVASVIEHNAGGIHLLQARRAGAHEERGAGAGPVRDTRQLRVALRAAHAAGDEGVQHGGGGAFGQHGGARYAQGGEAQGGGRSGGGGVPGQRRVPIREWAQPSCGRGFSTGNPSHGLFRYSIPENK
ncbi:unnamed protein product [Musa acuminata subsp. burmannicoides]